MRHCQLSVGGKYPGKTLWATIAVITHVFLLFSLSFLSLSLTFFSCCAFSLSLSVTLPVYSCGECEEKCDIVGPTLKAGSFGQDNNPTRRRLALSLSRSHTLPLLSACLCMSNVPLVASLLLLLSATAAEYNPIIQHEWACAGRNCKK